jgi:hypothetical protein
MYILGIHFHSWTPIYSQYIVKFRGRECKKEYYEYRTCLQCGVVEHSESSYSGDFYWRTLPACEARIVLEDTEEISSKLYLKELSYE